MEHYGRPRYISGWTKKATLDDLIETCEHILYEYAQTDSYDSGNRMAGTEAYLNGLLDAKRVLKNSNH